MTIAEAELSNDFTLEIDRLKAELSTSLAREKALREALQNMACTCEWPMHSEGHYDYCDKLKALKALDDPAPRVWTAKELRPILQTMERIYAKSPIPDDVNVQYVNTIWLRQECAKSIQHARSIGLLNEDSK